MPNRTRRSILSAAIAIPATAAFVGLTSGTAHAAYSWPRTLKEGMSGADVTQLQIRVGGYPGYAAVLAVDGVFGAKTKAAVGRFQSAYGLTSDGVAGPNTYNKIYSIQSSDNTPIHFTYAELNQCNNDWSGGNVSPATAKANALRIMWKLEALRHALGDQPIVISSGFRSKACNSCTGCSPTSRHMYGDAADLVGVHSFCTMAKQARDHGFANILGPGYPNHDDHVHVAGGGSTWKAPNCGINGR